MIHVNLTDCGHPSPLLRPNSPATSVPCPYRYDLPGRINHHRGVISGIPDFPPALLGHLRWILDGIQYCLCRDANIITRDSLIQSMSPIASNRISTYPSDFIARSTTAITAAARTDEEGRITGRTKIIPPNLTIWWFPISKRICLLIQSALIR